MPLRLVPPSTPTGTLRYYWRDPGGTTRDLTQATSPNLFVSKGATGLGDVDVELAAEKIPFASGKLVRHAGVPERVIDLPITVIEESMGDLVLVADALRTWFATADERRLRMGTFGVIRQDDSVREIAAHRIGGIGGDLGRGGPAAMTYVVSLYCPDPFPTAGEDAVATYGQADFGDEIVIINDGELDAYPIWTATGPWSGSVTPGFVAYEVENTATHEAFSFYFALSAGVSVIVDTRPASSRTNKAIRRIDDLNLFGFLNPNPSLWWLAPGENRFRITMAGGTTGGTSVELRYLPRYRGLLR